MDQQVIIIFRNFYVILFKYLFKKMGVKMKIISIFISFLFLSFSLNADTIKYWTTEEQPARMMKQVQMAVDFNKASGHNVTVIPISESEMGKRAVAMDLWQQQKLMKTS